MNWTVEDAARLLGAGLERSSREPVTSVVVDSRRAAPGSLFVALRGETLDGHDFVTHALRAGAAAAVTQRPVPDAPGPVLVVSDPVAALARLAGWARDALDPIVVGVTGSTGKTSVKDFLASVARRGYATAASERSYNNEIGVPLTLLSAPPGTEVVVCEMGSRGAGHLRQICEYARPVVGVVTNIGVTHYEQFGSRDAIADAKAELIESLPDGGTAVLNADDPLVAAMARRTEANVVTYGTGPVAWLRAERVRLNRLGCARFALVRGFEAAEVELTVAGRHHVHNALAAAAAGLALGIPLFECRAGLQEARASPWRMEVHEAGDVIVVNDAYNASPTSMAAALETCGAIVPPHGRLVAVLGYMAELGDIEEAEHLRIGRLAAARAKQLIVVGGAAAGIAEGARGAGLEDVRVAEGRDEALGLLAVRAGDVVLIKASRVAGLERLGDDLLGHLREGASWPT
ncbi:MAG: UDP-N-acetylmuramoyl-tripeptide--D-alanyl-D-alanine ligase [Actinomycetota bacterium]